MEDHDASANPLYDVDDVDASFGVDQQQQLVHNAAATFDSSWGLSPLGSSFSMLGPDQAYPAQTQTPQAQYGPTLSQSLSGFAFGGYNAPVGFATPDTLYGAPTTGYEQNPQFAGHGVDVTGLAGFGHAPPPQPTETISPYALINGGARPGQADLGQASQSLPVQHVSLSEMPCRDVVDMTVLFRLLRPARPRERTPWPWRRRLPRLLPARCLRRARCRCLGSARSLPLQADVRSHHVLFHRIS